MELDLDFGSIDELAAGFESFDFMGEVEACERVAKSTLRNVKARPMQGMATLRRATLRGRSAAAAVDLEAQQRFLDADLDVEALVTHEAAFASGTDVWACWLEDGCWYEAVVSCVNSDASYLVTFKGYGNEQVCDESYLRPFVPLDELEEPAPAAASAELDAADLQADLAQLAAAQEEAEALISMDAAAMGALDTSAPQPDAAPAVPAFDDAPLAPSRRRPSSTRGPLKSATLRVNAMERAEKAALIEKRRAEEDRREAEARAAEEGRRAEASARAKRDGEDDAFDALDSLLTVAMEDSPDDVLAQLEQLQSDVHRESKALRQAQQATHGAELAAQDALARPPPAAAPAPSEEDELLALERQMEDEEQKRAMEVARAQELAKAEAVARYKEQQERDMQSRSKRQSGATTKPAVAAKPAAAPAVPSFRASGSSTAASQVGALHVKRAQVQQMVSQLEVATRTIAARKLMRVQMREEIAEHSVHEVETQRKAIRLEAHQASVAARRAAMACGGLEVNFRKAAGDLIANAKCLLVMVGVLVNQTNFKASAAKLKQTALDFQAALAPLVRRLKEQDAALRAQGATGTSDPALLAPFVAALKPLLSATDTIVAAHQQSASSSLLREDAADERDAAELEVAQRKLDKAQRALQLLDAKIQQAEGEAVVASPAGARRSSANPSRASGRRGV